MFSGLSKALESTASGDLDVSAWLSLCDGAGTILLVAVLIELILPLPSSLRLSSLAPFLRALASKVNLEKDSDPQKLFAGIMLPCVIFLSIWSLGLLIDAATGFDTLLSLFILPFLLNSRSSLDTAWQIYYLLRHDKKDQARKVLQKKLHRNCSRLSHMGLSKACCEYTIMSLASNWIAVMVWFAIAGLEGALIMQMSSVMFVIFSSKNNTQFHIFGTGIRRIHQFMLIPVAVVCILCTVFSFHPLRALNAAFDASTKHPARISGLLEGLYGGLTDVALGGPREYGDLIYRYPRIGGELQPSSDSLQQITKCMLRTGMIFCLICAVITVITS